MTSQELIWDNSFIGEYTDDKNMVVEKLTPNGMIELCIEVVKGIFYLPANPFHTGVIQKDIVEPDGSEIRTRCKYVIRPSPVDNRIPLSKFTPEMLSDNELDLVRKTFMFAWIIRYNNINENCIEIRTLITDGANNPASLRIPILKRQNLDIPAIPAFPREIIRKWFANNLGNAATNQMLDNIFERAIQEYLRPYRSPVTLRYKMDKLLYKYRPSGPEGPDAMFSSIKSKFISDIMKNIMPGPARESVKEPKKR
jgi:hypothetical protein